MKKFLFRLYLNLMKLVARFTRINNKSVVILNGAGRSGSNGYIFAKYLQKNHPEYKVTVVEPWPSSHLPFSIWRKIGQAKFIVTTHQPFKIHSRQINVQFWHGVPLKRMGIMANNTDRKADLRNVKLWQKNVDIVCSSSDLYETMMSACCAIDTSKYQKVGFPRTDALKNPVITKKQLLYDLFKQIDDQAQIGIYMPTFRYELEDSQIINQIKAGNFFALPDFDIESLNQNLKRQHQYLLVKLHPYEQKLVGNFTSQYSQIAFLNDDYLFEHECDLYELLGSTSFLITDFSSIYFDYLAFDRPIIFITNFLAQYQKKRGLLIGPYTEVVPGPCVKSQKELVAALSAPNNYQTKRHYWYNLTNQVQGISACDAIFKMMTKD
ncbi:MULTISPECIES: CDP-glycerol glycerophosphotransferase family protein [unclassified Lactobacillus]|uniref:CDP-glycerol glycerophosphotransferase family protein n=1 Tax=unclassified Lactobacillus TaxID=2620435 RepID=UPI000EFB44D5|nr:MULTISPECIES: CDP-glycerol glycerophosphotransferase family protein [unclassified Lactobacillus]RMC24881.1 CDP-glycerol--glycerophosphate glycerophosphotransferase [Lactobacillus sp. ESL0247]RMC29035.1 CDP-glycerol--glycerophosphate glycerophosphotransferase [Lactobacillus sp. ESL0246]RMC32638.1 CDP-glycerol--glycerophosphate glycerophosphotransferase [Lactobacillus sp. ESL0245]